MYKVFYLLEDYALSKEFETFEEAAVFGIKQPKDSILEIKHYDTKTNYFQNKSNNTCTD